MIPGDPVKVFDLHRRTRLYCWQPDVPSASAVGACRCVCGD